MRRSVPSSSSRVRPLRQRVWSSSWCARAPWGVRPMRLPLPPASRSILSLLLESAAMSTPVQKLFDLSGRVALVTGGSRGLGLQIAEALGESGARVMLTSRKAADLEEAAAHLRHRGIDVEWLAADASEPAEVQRV